ncbi:MAG: hypothetical protein LBP26_05325 [Clostridiales bacterium]|jgi:hypothetical protein|nr:hypothetical protein [Clostridiales bacterium]
MAKQITKANEKVEKNKRGKFAIKHDEGILVRNFGDYLIHFSGDFSRAMTFNSYDDAKATADFLNRQVSNPSKNTRFFYSVVSKKDYENPII